MSKFLWGAATSAHQVEGGNVHNDWWAWEKSHQDFEQSGKAADHYNRFQEDFKLARDLGHSAHRFSIEWSRIEPAPNQWNQQAIEHYRQVLLSLKENGLTTFVTLHHFTNPQWFAEDGGWLQPRAAKLFSRYVKKVVAELGDLVEFWVTINEPMVYATQSYIRGAWPPQAKSLRQMWRVIKHLALGHQLAYHAIHKQIPNAKVGVAKHLVAYFPEHKNQWDDRLFARLENWWFNHRWFKLTGDTHDFVGVNYYFTRKYEVKIFPPFIKQLQLPGEKSDLGWPLRPDGFEHVLLEAKKYKLPIYVTENGLADSNDKHREEFIRSHLRALERAQKKGADVRGYLHWSLLDNFEWAEGFGPRFGLVAVDYETQERKPRGSAYVYKAIIEQASRDAD